MEAQLETVAQEQLLLYQAVLLLIVAAVGVLLMGQLLVQVVQVAVVLDQIAVGEQQELETLEAVVGEVIT